MQYTDFLETIINRGIIIAKENFVDECHKEYLDGSITGLEACRDCSPQELYELYNIIFKYTNESLGESNYWFFKSYEIEIEWVMNCVSALLINQGKYPLLSHLPTARGYITAVKVLNRK